MTKAKKIIIIIILVISLVVGLIWGFFKIFHFEDNKEKTPTYITDQEVEELYANMYVEAQDNNYTFYNGYFTKYKTLSKEYVLTVAYQNLIKKGKLTDYVVKEFSPEIMHKINQPDLIPLYQIKGKLFSQTIKELFNQEEKDFTNFTTNNLGAYYNEADNTFYIYQLTNQDAIDYAIIRQKIGYEITNQGQNLIIYEYFIKCDKTTQNCYNDTHLAMPNREIKYDHNLNPNTLVEYKHTFNLAIDHYYWYSSEIVKN